MNKEELGATYDRMMGELEGLRGALPYIRDAETYTDVREAVRLFEGAVAHIYKAAGYPGS